MHFIGRRHELETLNRQYHQPGASFLPIYGRRRVGKSELIRHFIRNRTAVYFVAKKGTAATNISEFREVAAQTLGESLLARLETWSELMEEIPRRWKGGEKLILVLDEFQWAAQASPELPSILQTLWDRDWQRNGRVMIILCGSQIGFMEREILGRESPLFGRGTAQIHLQPFDHLEASRFQPRYNIEDQALTYLVTGGIPYYLREFRDSRSVEQNIMECLLDEHSVLAGEADFLLREELREIAPYYSILMALATGAVRHKEIGRHLGGDTRNLNYYLRQLQTLRYVRKRYPVTGRAPLAREVRYEIADPLLRFWFHFIFPRQSQIRYLTPVSAFHTLIKPGLAAYWGQCFEGFCREVLPRIYAGKENVFGPLEVGEYWDKSVQIDVVAIRPDHRTDLAECRWGTVRSIPSVLNELDEKAGRYPNRLNHSIGRRLFVRHLSPSASRPRDVTIHTLADLYEF